MPFVLPAALAGGVFSKSALTATAMYILAEIGLFARRQAKTALIAGAYLAAVTLALDAIKTELVQRLAGMPADLIAILTMMGIDHAVTMIISAGLTKHALRGLAQGQAAQ